MKCGWIIWKIKVFESPIGEFGFVGEVWNLNPFTHSNWGGAVGNNESKTHKYTIIDQLSQKQAAVWVV